jgi:hypothetical protein
MSFVKDQLVRFAHWLAIEHYKENATMQTFLQEEMILRFDEYMSKYSVTSSIVNAMLEERNKRTETADATATTIQKKTKKMAISFAEDGSAVMKTAKKTKVKTSSAVEEVIDTTTTSSAMEDATLEVATTARKKNEAPKGSFDRASFDRAELARFIHGKKENLDNLTEGFLATLDGASLPSKKSILRAISEISVKEKTIYIVKQECQEEMGIQLDIIVFPVTKKRKASKMKTKKMEEEDLANDQEEEELSFPTEEEVILDAQDLCEELNVFADIFPTTQVRTPTPISGKQAFCDEMNKQKRMRLEKEIEETEQKLREKQRRLLAVANGAMIFSDEEEEEDPEDPYQEEEEEEEEVEYKEIFIGDQMLVYNPLTNDVYDTRGMDLLNLSSSNPPIIGKFNPITHKIVMNNLCPYRPPSSTSAASSACGF